MIDKVIPQRLNSDVDSRFRPSTDMIDALNIAFQESYNTDAAAAGSEASVSFSGDAGVIKPMPSNVSVQTFTTTTVIEDNTDIRVIGSVSDEVFNVIYFFAWSNQSDQMGVYAWDQDGVLPGSSAGSYVKVYTSPKFNFPSDGFVKADVVHVGQRKNIEDQDRIRNVILYFTDNKNEPKKLSVYDVMEGFFGNYNDIDLLDLITACPRTPLQPIFFQFDFDPSRLSSNFTSLPGLQFAYQHVYADNVESALSTYSKLAVPPAYLALGQVTGSVNLQNRCILTVPRGSKEVDRIRLLVRYGNLGLWRLIDEIKDLPDAVDSVEYNFYNDRILIPLSEETTNMPYSNLPRIAQAQSVVSDRLVYGNYVESYPEVEASADITPIYRNTPRQGDVIEIEVIPVINQLDARNDDLDSTRKEIYKKLGTNRVAGYQINLDGVPENFLESDTIIQLDFTVQPDNNFHFYNQHNSYHASRENGLYGGEANQTGDNLDNINDALIDTIQEGDSAGDFFNNVNQYTRGRQYFGRNEGVKFIDNLNKWSYNFWTVEDTDYGNLIGAGGGGSINVSYGTSAANPFILHSKALRFSLTFKTQYDTESPRNDVKATIYNLLTGHGAIPQDTNGTSFATTEGFPEPVNISSYEIDLNLVNNDEIVSEYSNDYRKHLIVALTRTNDGSQSSVTDEPIGFFIVNKAKVEFELKEFTYMEDLYDIDSGSSNCYIGLDLKSLTDVDVMTCIPYVPVGNKIPIKIPGSFGSNGDSYFGITATNVINGNIRSWKVFTREHMRDTDVGLLGVYDTGDESSWSGNLGYVGDGVLDSFNEYDTRNLYYFANGLQYSSIFAEESTTGNDDFPSGIDPVVDLGLAILPAGINQSRGVWSLGYLTGPGDSISEDLNLINTSDEIYFQSQSEISTDQLVKEASVFSLVDGEGGPGFTKNRTGVGEFVSWGSISPYVLFKGDIHNRWIVDVQQLPYTNAFPALGNTGVNLGDSDPGDTPGFGTEADGWRKSKGFLKSFRNTDINNPSDVLDKDYFSGAQADLNYDYPIADTINTWIEITVLTTYITGITGLYYPRSFKTNANHDFGIVYYDQRGRSGNVNYLGNTFVKGYSNADRGLDAKGRVDIRLFLTSNPPQWATQYQIVYSPNSTIDEFVQYSTGPAFVANISEEDPADGNEALIYVNLGHLQGANNVSYSHAFGAVNNDGGKDLYTHTQGDRLRILYYTEIDGDGVVYPKDYIFDIVDVVTLSRNSQDNILFNSANSGQVSPAKSGQFLVLKNNPEALGFTYSDVLNSYGQQDSTYDTDGSTSLNFWNNRTVVEIFTPKKVQDFDERLYYEIGEKYDTTLNVVGNVVHSQAAILLRDGDVWWRRVPVNLQVYNSTVNRFLSLFSASGSNQEEEDQSLPFFATQVLETMAFTDVIPGCKTLDWGKPKIIVPGSQSLYKRSSLTYSDKNNYSSRANRYTIFNATSLNFKDLPNEYGAINYILNDYDNLVVIQEDKASSIPVNRNIISTAGGQQSLVASKDILGTQKFYAGNYGADNNPEGVVRAGEAIYFAHKGRREVYKLTRSKGLKVISKARMKAHFNNLFIQALKDEADGNGKVRVVSGYDPLRDEYIISVYNMQNFSQIDYNPLTGVFDGINIVFEDTQTINPGIDGTVPTAFEDFGETGDEIVDVDDDIFVDDTTISFEADEPQISVSPGIISFASVSPTVTQSGSFNIFNGGEGPLIIDSITSVIVNASAAPAGVALTLVSDPTALEPLTIQPFGNSGAINYTVSPVMGGTTITASNDEVIGQIEITSNDPNNSTFILNFALTYILDPIQDGDSDIDIGDESGALLFVEPNAINFGTLPQSDQQAIDIFVTNNGDQNLLITGHNINLIEILDGGISAYFDVGGFMLTASNNDPYVILPGVTDSFQVVCYAPSASENIQYFNNYITSNLEILSNSISGAETIPLTAFFEIDPIPDDGNPDEDTGGDDQEIRPELVVTPSTIQHLSIVPSGTLSGSFEMKNVGLDPLQVGTITVAIQNQVANAAFITLASGLPITINPTVDVVTVPYTILHPTQDVFITNNAFSGSVVITSNDPVNPQYFVPFTVTYIAQDVDDPTDFDDHGGGDDLSDDEPTDFDPVRLVDLNPEDYFEGLAVYGNSFQSINSNNNS